MSKIISVPNESKKETISKNAAKLFRKKGFSATSMRELAVDIGVEASSLYNHIGSKSELLQIICFKVANDFINQINELEQVDIGVTSKLEKIIRFHIYKMLEDYDMVYVANHEWKHLQDPFLKNFLNQRKLYENKLIELIKIGISEKSIKKLNPQVLAFTILSAVRGLEFWQQHKKNIDISELEKTMVTQLLTGIIK